MHKTTILGHLEQLRDVIREERRAAKALQVDEMLALTEQKEQLLKQLLPMVESIEALTPEEQEMAETVHSENLRNAYFFWSALKWVRESVDFISEQMYPGSYGVSGSMVKGSAAGALLSGRI